VERLVVPENGTRLDYCANTAGTHEIPLHFQRWVRHAFRRVDKLTVASTGVKRINRDSKDTESSRDPAATGPVTQQTGS